MTRVLAGPLCTMILGDLGADVIKVERPGSGDESRGWGPPFADDGQSAYFLSVNRNKLGIALDLSSGDDRKLVNHLALGADVVVENFLPGVLERHGIESAGLLRAREQLLWCTISGFGAGSERPGYDFVIQAESGWMAVTGEPDGTPMKVGIALADVIAGKDAAIAILAGLIARDRAETPLGVDARHIRISLLQSAASALVNVAQNVLVSGAAGRRWGNAHPNLVPYQLFNAVDRPIVVAVGNDPQWLKACRALELSALADDHALRTNAGRVAGRARVVAAFARRIAERPAASWLSALRSAGVPCGVVRDVRDALQSVEASPRTGVSPPIPGSVRLPPPRLDEHGEAIRRSGWEAFRHRG